MAWTDRRPLSPHLQIYKLPLTALLSIGHRGSGAVLVAGGLLLVCLLLGAAGGEERYTGVHAVVSSWFGILVLFGFSFALYLHLFNGLRHLLWDIGWGFDLETADRSAKGVIAGTLLLTILTWLVAL